MDESCLCRFQGHFVLLNAEVVRWPIKGAKKPWSNLFQNLCNLANRQTFMLHHRIVNKCQYMNLLLLGLNYFPLHDTRHRKRASNVESAKRILLQLLEEILYNYTRTTQINERWKKEKQRGDIRTSDTFSIRMICKNIKSYSLRGNQARKSDVTCNLHIATKRIKMIWNGPVGKKALQVGWERERCTIVGILKLPE